MLQEKKINPMIGIIISEFALSDRFGWLPSEIENEKIMDIDNYLAIMRGLGKSTSERKIKKELR